MLVQAFVFLETFPEKLFCGLTPHCLHFIKLLKLGSWWSGMVFSEGVLHVYYPNQAWSLRSLHSGKGVCTERELAECMKICTVGKEFGH